jgi:hypothetical protein
MHARKFSLLPECIGEIKSTSICKYEKLSTLYNEVYTFGLTFYPKSSILSEIPSKQKRTQSV